MIDLPKRKDLVITNNEDPIIFYYLPISGWFYKKRLEDVLKLLGGGKYGRLLEIGFGSGILFPELLKRCDNLYGLEVHDRISDVQKYLSQNGMKAELTKWDILKMDYPDNFFDAVVSVSTLEHIKDLETASSEIRRILKPGGVAVLGFPARNAVTDFIFKIFGQNPRGIHPSSHEDILKAFGEKMEQESALSFPKFLKMYVSAKFLKK